LLILFSVLFNCTGEKSKIDEERLTFFEEAEIERIFLQEKVDQLQDLLEESYKKYDFNGHILVSYRGKLIFNNFIGYADLSTRDTLTYSAPYQLASMSKQFTAMCIMMLHEWDSLDYDDKMVEYIPELAEGKVPYYDHITIRHLLHHTSGLPNYMYYVEKYKRRDEHPYNDEVVKLMSRHKHHLNFIPGRRFLYSNTGYMILALIVERVSGKRFADFVKDHIFTPLNMKNSFVYSRAFDEEQYSFKLKGFRKRYRYYPVSENRNDGVVGDKGIYSTAMDLYKWDQALYQERLVSKSTLLEAFRPGELPNGRHVNYGFGFRIRRDYEKEWVVYHHGLWNGFRTSFIRFIDENSSIILLNNTDCRAKHIITREVEKILRTKDNDYTRFLVEKTLNEGIDSASMDYYMMNNLDPDLSIDIDDLDRIQQFLYGVNKYQMASRIDQLKMIIYLTVNS
jgi:CubicO group peptidase (beta-lactamase class C family)